MRAKGKPPRLRQLRWLREILLMTQPPLLAVVQGGECAGSEISALRVGTYTANSSVTAPWAAVFQRTELDRDRTTGLERESRDTALEQLCRRRTLEAPKGFAAVFVLDVQVEP